MAGAAGVVLVAYIYALVVETALVLPMLAALGFLDLVRWWLAVAGGVIASMVFVFILGGSGRAPLTDVLFLASIGGLSGLTFWIVWRLGEKQKGPA